VTAEFLLDTNVISEAMRVSPDPAVIARMAEVGAAAVTAAPAAVAAVRSLTLVTRDVRDFERFADLRVESWSSS
jgi:predicted nucleic acid-binding protein